VQPEIALVIAVLFVPQPDRIDARDTASTDTSMQLINRVASDVSHRVLLTSSRHIVVAFRNIYSHKSRSTMGAAWTEPGISDQ
jgi:hypothetical protein